MGFGLGVHADDDDQRNETIVCDDLGLLQGPSAPLLEALTNGFFLFRALQGLAARFALALQ